MTCCIVLSISACSLFMTWPFLVGCELRDFHFMSQGQVALFPRHGGVTDCAGLCVSVRNSIGQC